MKKTKLGTNTNLIRGGLNRSQFNETSEALFLTSGFVYDSAEQAEAIFKGSKKVFSILVTQILPLKLLKKG